MAARPDEETPDSGNNGSILLGAPERAFVLALRNGWEWVKQTPGAWDLILRQADTIELALIKQVFAPAGRYQDFPIRTGYPSAQTESPQITVTTEMEEEEVGLLGHYTGEPDDLVYPEGQGGEVYGQIRAMVITVTVCASHPDTVIYLARAVDGILLAHSDWFMRGAGLMRADFLSVGPLMPDQSRDPSPLWMKEIRWRVAGLGGCSLPIPAPKALGVRLDVAGGRVRVNQSLGVSPGSGS